VTGHAAEVSIRLKARMAGAVYLLVFLAGGAAVLASSGLFVLTDAAATATNIMLHEQRFWLGFTFNLIVIASYVIVTAMFYDLFKPVSRRLSLQAALFSVVGCAVQAAALVFYAVMLRLVLGIARPRQPILGLVLAGKIESTGKAIKRFRVGDRVYAFTKFHFGCYAHSPACQKPAS
jgi:hypothetical protein